MAIVSWPIVDTEPVEPSGTGHRRCAASRSLPRLGAGPALARSARRVEPARGGCRFEHAVAATPDYAPAHAGLASACFLQYECSARRKRAESRAAARARTHARAACLRTRPVAGRSVGHARVRADRGRAKSKRRGPPPDEPRRSSRRAGGITSASAIATWGEERLRAVDRTLGLLPDFAPARFLAVMVFVARQALRARAEAAAASAPRRRRGSAGRGSAVSGRRPALAARPAVLLRTAKWAPRLQAFTREIDRRTTRGSTAPSFASTRSWPRVSRTSRRTIAAGAVEAFRWALDAPPERPGAGRLVPARWRRPALRPTPGYCYHESMPPSRSWRVAAGWAKRRLSRPHRSVARGDVDERLRDASTPARRGATWPDRWLIPIDPALAPLRATAGFEKIAAQLAARAS